MSAEAIRVLVVDDHTLFRKGVKALLATIEHVEVAGEACSGPEAVALARDLRPDIVLMDLEMPGGGGLAATVGRCASSRAGAGGAGSHHRIGRMARGARVSHPAGDAQPVA